MPYRTKPRQNCVAPAVRFFCALSVIAVLFFIVQGTAEASSFSHSHKPVLTFADNEKVDSHSCPLFHHPRKEVCPLTHQSISLGGVVIKNCGGSPAEGGISVMGFSKESVAPNSFDDFRLSLESRSPYILSSFYVPILAVPLDHPPRSL